MRKTQTLAMETETAGKITTVCGNCGYEWNYNGERTYPDSTSCPKCGSRVTVPKKRRQ